jgi:putative hemolysin
MDLGHLTLLLLLPALILASGFVSGSETALFSLSYADRARLRRESPGAASAAGALLGHPRALLISLLLANNAVNVLYMVVSSVFAARIGQEFEGRGAKVLAILFAVGSLLALILLGEILPKLLARRLRVEFCRLAAPPVLAIHRLIGPARSFVDHGLVAPLSRLLAPARPRERTVTTEELSALLELSAREGVIAAEDHRLLEDVVELSTIRVRDVMTPRVDVTWLPADATEERVVEAVRLTGRSRFPVHRPADDTDLLGWLDAKIYLVARQVMQRPPAVTDCLRPVLFVPERARLDQLLDLLRRSKRYEAVCVDEYGSVVGIVAIDDVLRQLVAEPAGEGGPDASGVERVAAGTWRVSGRMSVKDLAEFFERPGMGGNGLDRSVSTVGGLILLRLGRVPRVGDVVTLGNVSLRVESMDQRAVRGVLVEIAEPVGGGRA